MTRSLAIIGTGGHAKVVIAAARASGWDVTCAFDSRPDRTGQEILGVPIVGPPPAAAARGIPAIIAIGNNAVRKTLAAELALEWATIIHPTAWVAPSAVVGPGTIIMAGVILQPDANVGVHTICNTACSIDHDCHIGDYVHIGPGAHLCGAVSVGAGTLFGVGASAKPSITIGPDVVIGAGAAVICDAPSGTWLGVPARKR